MGINDHLTPEVIEKAQRERKRKREEKIVWARENIKLNWLDLNDWKKMASKAGVRLPAWYEPMNPSKMRKAVKRITGVRTAKQWEDETGIVINEFAKLNKYSPLYVFYGIVLETLED